MCERLLPGEITRIPTLNIYPSQPAPHHPALHDHRILWRSRFEETPPPRSAARRFRTSLRMTAAVSAVLPTRSVSPCIQAGLLEGCHQGQMARAAQGSAHSFTPNKFGIRIVALEKHPILRYFALKIFAFTYSGPTDGLAMPALHD